MDTSQPRSTAFVPSVDETSDAPGHPRRQAPRSLPAFDRWCLLVEPASLAWLPYPALVAAGGSLWRIMLLTGAPHVLQFTGEVLEPMKVCSVDQKVRLGLGSLERFPHTCGRPPDRVRRKTRQAQSENPGSVSPTFQKDGLWQADPGCPGCCELQLSCSQDPRRRTDAADRLGPSTRHRRERPRAP